MLTAAAESSGAFRIPAEASRWEPARSGGFVHVRSADKNHVIRASTALDCTGRTAAIAHRYGSHRISYDKLIAAIALHVTEAPGDNDFTTVVQAVEGGWWYSSLLPSRKRIFAFLTDSDLCDRAMCRHESQWVAFLKQAEHMDRLNAAYDYRPEHLPVLVPAGSSRLCPAAGDEWIAAGDAALAIDPLSSQGILNALELGINAASAIAQALSGDRSLIAGYLDRLEELSRHFLQRRRHYYTGEERWMDAPFWKRRSETK